MPYSSNLLTVIITHGGFPVAAQNHTPLWKALGGKMLTFFPGQSLTEDAPPNYPVSPQIAHGAAAKLDPLSAERFYWLLNHLVDHTEADYFLLFTQATLCLSPKLPEKLFEKDVLWGAFPALSEDQLAPVEAPQWPLFFSRNVAKKLVSAINAAFGAKPKPKGEMTAGEGAKALVLPSEMEIWSEMVASLIRKRLIEHGALGKLAFVRDSIENSDEAECLKAIRSANNGGSGAIFLHGVKSTVAQNRNVFMYQYAYDQRDVADVPHSIGVTISRQPKNAKTTVVSTPSPRPQLR
jgi:hypothetical protein